MRVLQADANADFAGGAENYRRGLTAELRRRGHTVHEFGASPDRSVQDESATIVQRPTFAADRLVVDHEVVDAFRSCVERTRPEIVHLHNLHHLAVDLDRSLCDLDVPVIWTAHDFSTVCPNAWLVRGDGSACGGGIGRQCLEHGCQANYPFDAATMAYGRLRHALLSRRADVVICPSRFQADVLRSHGYPDVRAVYNFVDAECFAPEPQDPGADGHPTLLFVGRLDREKGVEYLIDALPTIAARVPGVRLDLVGDGSIRADLERLAEERGVGERLTFHGRAASTAELRSHYARAALAVMPSVWAENSPLVAYECMAAGLPLVASRIGGIPELVDDGVTGVLVGARQPAEIAAAIVELLTSPPTQASMRAAARERGRRFTRAAAVDEIEAIYAEAQGREGARARAALFERGFDETIDALIVELNATRDKLAEVEGHAHKLESFVGELEQSAGADRHRLAQWLRGSTLVRAALRFKARR